MSNGEQKAAALTPEQIRNLPAIRKKYLVVLISYALIVLIIFAVIYFYFANRERELRDESLNLTPGFSTSLKVDYNREAAEKADQAHTNTKIAMIAFFAVEIVGAIVIIMILKSKYPYYSDSAYSYLKQKGAFTQN